MQRIIKEYKNIEYIEYAPDEVWNGQTGLFLHGSGEKGSDINLVDRIGLPKLLKNGFEHPVKWICPQISVQMSSWNNTIMNRLLEMFSEKIHIVGISLGGSGAFNIAINRPDKFLSCGVVCGKAAYAPKEIVPIPVRAWHGTNDNVYPYSNVKNQINLAGGSIVTYEGAGHNVWDKAFDPTASDSYWKWLESFTSASIPEPEPIPTPEPEKKFTVTIDQGTFKTDNFSIQ